MTALAGIDTLVRLILRRDRWLLPLWISLLGGYPLLMVIAQESLNPTAESRLSYVANINSNSAFLMLEGLAYGDSVGALGIWAAGDMFWMIGLASLLAVIRHTRAEEETGRRELLGATVVGRHANLAAALTVTLAAGLASGSVATLALIGRGLPTGGSIALGLSLALTGWMFAAVAAVAAQLTESAATAKGIAVASLGASWLLRAAGDVGGPNGSVSWLSWLSPIGWARRTRPFAGEYWWTLMLAVGVVVAVMGTAVTLASRRDVGAGVLRPRLGPATASSGLRNSLALAFRLHRGPMLGWATGLAVLSGVLSGSAKSAGDLFETNPEVGDMFKLVGGGTGPNDVYLSAIMGMIGLIAAAFAVQAALRPRSEEEALRAEPVLATGVGRLRWAASHLVFALLGPTLAMAVAGLTSGLVYGLSVGDVPGQLPRVLAGAVVQLPAIWTLTGVTIALVGLLPRLAFGGWALLAAFLLLWVFQMSFALPQRLLDTPPFNHVPRLPGGDRTVSPMIWLVVIAAVLVVSGLVGFRRRDIGSV